MDLCRYKLRGSTLFFFFLSIGAVLSNPWFAGSGSVFSLFPFRTTFFFKWGFLFKIGELIEKEEKNMLKKERILPQIRSSFDRDQQR